MTSLASCRFWRRDVASPHPRPLSGERGAVIRAEPGGVAFSLSRLAGEGQDEGKRADVDDHSSVLASQTAETLP
jgi:hypothetical protein